MNERTNDGPLDRSWKLKFCGCDFHVCISWWRIEQKKKKKKDGSKQSLGEWVPTMKGLIIKNYKSLTCPEIWKIIHRCGARWWVEIGLPLLYFSLFPTARANWSNQFRPANQRWRRAALSGIQTDCQCRRQTGEVRSIMWLFSKCVNLMIILRLL